MFSVLVDGDDYDTIDPVINDEPEIITTESYAADADQDIADINAEGIAQLDDDGASVGDAASDVNTAADDDAAEAAADAAADAKEAADAAAEAEASEAQEAADAKVAADAADAKADADALETARIDAEATEAAESARVEAEAETARIADAAEAAQVAAAAARDAAALDAQLLAALDTTPDVVAVADAPAAIDTSDDADDVPDVVDNAASTPAPAAVVDATVDVDEPATIAAAADASDADDSTDNNAANSARDALNGLSAEAAAAASAASRAASNAANMVAAALTAALAASSSAASSAYLAASSLPLLLNSVDTISSSAKSLTSSFNFDNDIIAPIVSFVDVRPALLSQSQIESFRFELGVTPLSAVLGVVATVALYILTITIIKRLVALRGKGFKLESVVILHNSLMSITSAVLLFALSSALFEILQSHGVWSLVCDPLGLHTSGTIYYIYYLNYLFKFVELFDTILLALRGKPIPFLHAYHHAATLVLCWSQLWAQSCVQFLPIVINLGVHVLMYAYYTLHACGINVWWKKHLTKLQIVQFVAALIGCILAFGSRIAAQTLRLLPIDEYRCYGTYEGAYVGIFIIASYLYLFVVMYRGQYSTKRNVGQQAGAAGAVRAQRLNGAAPTPRNQSTSFSFQTSETLYNGRRY